jgi:hypothetical protein
MGLKIGWKLRRVSELAGFFYHQRVVGFDVPNMPHFDPASTGTFLTLLGASKFYLEFGSGGSTVAAAKQKIRTITVESDRYFAKAVKSKIGVNANNTMLIINTGITVEWSFPLFTRKTSSRVRRWSSYVDIPLNLIDRSHGHFPDLILIDGRFRKACALACAARAIEMAVATTICFDDYADRDWYHDVETHLGKPEMIGRMAIFKVLPGNKQPLATVIHEAMLDFR